MHLFDIGVPGPARYPTIASAFNDTGLVTAAAASNGNFDGAGHSYNAGELAAEGLKPGASVTASGVRFTWPRYGPSRLDNIRTQGQSIGVRGSGQVLGFLGAATLETQRGTITIHYSDGTTQAATLTFADWRANQAATGGTVVATVPLESGKTVVSVTLPVNIDVHVFAIAEGA